MAKFQPILGDLRGSIGDNTFSINRGGAYVRRRATPVNRNTVRQQLVRTVFGTVSGKWALLTDAQRAAWALWASLNPVLNSFGMSKILSGQQAFVMLNTRVWLSTGAVVTSTPSALAPAALTTCTVTANTGTTLTLAFTPTPQGASNKVYVWMCPPSGAGRDPNQNQSRFAAFGAANTASPLTITTPFALVTGQVANIWVAVLGPDGQTSAFLKIRQVLA